MRAITRQDSYGDPKIDALARDTRIAFQVVPFQVIIRVQNVTWSEPFYLTVPSEDASGAPRKASPEIIRCERATHRTQLVTPGGVSFEWVGNGRARLDSVSGLSPGQTYDLVVFTAVG